jgi:Ser-tRNA(Ala) deacylase AlaX
MVKIESKVNEIINLNLPVREEYLHRDEALKSFSLDKLPDQAGNDIRIIKIGDYDACPCIGKHVTSTKEIGGFKMISSSFEVGVLRLRFKLKD